jgi:hypothetical protein
MQKKKPTRSVYRPTKFGEGPQPGAAEWEMIRRRVRKEERDAELQLALDIQATRNERERESHSIWWSFFRIFRRFWPE